jgi:hypothetical protein
MDDDVHVMTFEKTEFGVGDLRKSRENEDQIRHHECSCVRGDLLSEVP